ncbi:RagB/SusD family nutrient uptake outer membrane protein [Chitinophaga sp.]|uniref:RagB/SusD family nutrient uptake outer membrane protein n=1 Tax=Chitinophaga sp. TaxID=1869181 RepID=UPI0031E1F336
MKLKYVIISAALLSTLLAGCAKELEKSPTDKFDGANFWTSESNTLLALTGVYRGNLKFNGTEVVPSDWWSYAGLLFMEFSTDNAYDRRGENSSYNKLSNGTLTANIDILKSYWSVSYAKIARANYFLENVEKVQINEATKKRFIAEVRFLRAVQYFYMAQFWGSVPLVKRTLTPDEANNVLKAPKAEIVQFVADEFNAAVPDLPRHRDVPPAERGRVSKQTVLAFLGRLHLAEGKYREAADAYKTIIDFGDNIIDPDYAGLFQTSNENSNEIIFSVQYIDNLAAVAMNQHFFPAVAGGWHIFCPLGSIVENYEFSDGTPFSYNDPRYDPQDVGKGRDPRLRYSVIYNGDTFKNLRYITHPDSSNSPDQLGAGKQTTQTGYGLKKICDESASTNLLNYGGNTPVIRYAEVLLSYLEAKLESGQAIDQALLDATINQVRGRASVNLPKVTETAPAALRTVLRRERRSELAFEGIRYWDLIRWKEATTTLNGDFYGAPFPNAVKTRKKGNITDPYKRWYVTSKAFRPADYTWPIPQSEINVNPNLAK